jgi:hypothetical protein
MLKGMGIRSASYAKSHKTACNAHWGREFQHSNKSVTEHFPPDRVCTE